MLLSLYLPVPLAPAGLRGLAPRANDLLEEMVQRTLDDNGQVTATRDAPSGPAVSGRARHAIKTEALPRRTVFPGLVDWFEEPLLTRRPYLAQLIRVEEYADDINSAHAPAGNA
ncbi:MAG TPA: hypothetical protein VH589_29645 [Trebonia sp.]